MLYSDKFDDISRTNFINLFADFILHKIPSNEITTLEIADCQNFYVIKGKTSSKTILDLNSVKDEFVKKRNLSDDNKNLFHTIDLIEYDVQLSETEQLCHVFFNTTNPHFSNCQLNEKTEKDNSLILKSNFPHGYSLKSGRDLYYYAKRICYNLQLYPFWESVKITINRTNNEENFQIFTDCNKEQDLKLRSAILDCFDFNYNKIGKDFENSNWVESASILPNDLDFVKEKNQEFILI